MELTQFRTKQVDLIVTIKLSNKKNKKILNLQNLTLFFFFGYKIIVGVAGFKPWMSLLITLGCAS